MLVLNVLTFDFRDFVSIIVTLFSTFDLCDVSCRSAHCGWQMKLEGVYHNCLSAKLDVTWDPEVFAGLTIKVRCALNSAGIIYITPALMHRLVQMLQPSAFVVGKRSQVCVTAQNWFGFHTFLGSDLSITVLVFERRADAPAVVFSLSPFPPSLLLRLSLRMRSDACVCNRV
jgi:hypothetical protein